MTKEAFEAFLATKPPEFARILAARIPTGSPGWTKYALRYQITYSEYTEAVLAASG